MPSEPLQCLIVEDEDDAVHILRTYIAQMPCLSLVAVCRDTITADQVLQNQKVDLVFLDIDLPGKSGIEWKRGIAETMQVIFTTADVAFGAEGFELDAVDYLLKPFSYGRFLRSLDRYQRLQGKPAMDSSAVLLAENRPFLMVRVERMLRKVYVDELLYIEARRNHLLFYLDSGTVKVYQPIRSIEDRLPQAFFLRIHRSFIVAIRRVRAYSSTIIQVEDVRLPLGRSYQSSVQDVLSR